MNRFICMICLVCVAAMASAESKWTISGKVVDSATKEPIQMAGVRVMKADSTYITGEATSELGIFIIKPDKGGKMIVKISSIGYKTVYRDITLARRWAPYCWNKTPWPCRGLRSRPRPRRWR